MELEVITPKKSRNYPYTNFSSRGKETEEHSCILSIEGQDNQEEDYKKTLTSVVEKMLSNTENFSDIEQHIRDNFWDLVG